MIIHLHKEMLEIQPCFRKQLKILQGRSFHVYKILSFHHPFCILKVQRLSTNLLLILRILDQIPLPLIHTILHLNILLLDITDAKMKDGCIVGLDRGTYFRFREGFEDFLKIDLFLLNRDLDCNIELRS